MCVSPGAHKQCKYGVDMSCFQFSIFESPRIHSIPLQILHERLFPKAPGGGGGGGLQVLKNICKQQRDLEPRFR